MRHRYGNWGKHLDLFDMFEDFRRDPGVLEAFREELEEEPNLLEGSGAPEGRVDFPIFLQTVIRHRTRERFRMGAAVWDQYVGIENAQDFREHTVSSLGGIRGIRGVREHGEYPRLRSTEEEGPSFAVGKYGGIYAVTYELVINDDTNQILNRIPRELGRSMAEYVNQAVAAYIESNPTYIDGVAFFHSSRGNNITGTAAEPTEDNLAAIIDAMALRRDADGIPIVIRPRRLLVRNPSTKMEFDRIIRSQQTGVTDDAQAVGAPRFFRGTYNPLQNVLPADATIEDPWLNDPNDWYLLADAEDRPPFITAFLRNRREPYIFMADASMRGVGGGMADPYTMDFDELPYKIRHVFGVSAGEPLAAVRAQP
jgi:hypothetical protein